MTTILGKIRTLRTTSGAIEDVVLEEGRLAYLTDQNALVSGDGSTTGSELSRIGSLEFDTSPKLSANLDLDNYSIISSGNFIVQTSGTSVYLNGVIDDSSSFGSKEVCIGGGRTYGAGSIAIGGTATSYGALSIALGGTFVFASGNNSLATGYATRTWADYAVATGRGAYARNYGMRAHAAGAFGSFNYGEAQAVDFVCRYKSTSATAVNLALNGTSTLYDLPTGMTFFGIATIAGVKSDGSQGAMYVRQFAVKNTSGTAELIGAPQTIGTDIADDAGWGAYVTTSSSSIVIKASGVAATTIRWVAHVQGVEIKYGT